MNNKMLILDFSQIALASVYAQKSDEINEDFFRHLILNSIRSLKTKFGKDAEVILAIDSPNSWRKEIFPYYKAGRKKARDASNINWDIVFQSIATIKNEIREWFPYKVIEVSGAEGDDVIGTLVNTYGDEDLNISKNIIIVSRDKDFIQLQKYLNVKQWNMIDQKWIIGDGKQYLKEHILKGDSGDGVPSAINSGDCLVLKIRQKPITRKKLDIWTTLSDEELSREFESLGFLSYLNRNREVIDLSRTPTDIQEKILEEYGKPVNRKDFTQYFIDKQLKYLYDYIGDF